MVIQMRTLQIVIALAIMLAGGTLTMAQSEQPGSRPMSVYVSLLGDHAIAAMTLDPAAGELRDIGRTAIAGNPGPMAVSASGGQLFVGDRANNRIVCFDIDRETSTLSAASEATTAGNPIYISRHPSAEFLLVACVGNVNLAAVHKIDGFGHVTSPPFTTVQAPTYPHCIRADRSGRYVFMSSLRGDVVGQFLFDKTAGALTSNSPDRVTEPAGAGPRHLIQHPQLDVLYTVNETNNTISAWRIDDQGRLTNLQTISTLPEDAAVKNYAADLEITPDGRLLIVSNRGHDTLALYRVDAKSGTLVAAGYVPTEAYPRDIAMDPSGRFLLAAGQNSGKLAVYRINDDRAGLTLLSAHDVGKTPVWVQFIDN